MLPSHSKPEEQIILYMYITTMDKLTGRLRQAENHLEITTLILTGTMVKMYGLLLQVGLQQLRIIVMEHIQAM